MTNIVLILQKVRTIIEVVYVLSQRHNLAFVLTKQKELIEFRNSTCFGGREKLFMGLHSSLKFESEFKITVIFSVKPLFYVFYKHKFVNPKTKTKFSICSTLPNGFEINMARSIKFA